MQETLVEIVKRASGQKIPPESIGSIIIYSVLSNRKRNSQEYRTGFADYFSKLEMNGIRNALASIHQFTLDEKTKMLPIPNELSDVLEFPSEIYQINFVCDALKYLRSQNKSWGEISRVIGEVALASMPAVTTPLKERENKSAYMGFLKGLTRRIAQDYGIYLGSPPKKEKD